MEYVKQLILFSDAIPAFGIDAGRTMHGMMVRR